MNVILVDKLPKNCEECPCLHWGEWQAFEKSWCAINSKIYISEKRRPRNCPLIKCDNEKKKEDSQND